MVLTNFSLQVTANTVFLLVNYEGIQKYSAKITSFYT
ncbi:MAG: hypothetical protein ACJAVD_000490 [Porticoccaceae bacterium]|jgi:hypothetical protein